MAGKFVRCGALVDLITSLGRAPCTLRERSEPHAALVIIVGRPEMMADRDDP
jgi:hypothetical protein